MQILPSRKQAPVGSSSIFLSSRKLPDLAEYSILEPQSSGSFMASAMAYTSLKHTGRDQPTDGIEMSGTERATFAPILESVDLDAISKFASRVRQSGHRSTASKPTGTMGFLDSIHCKVNTAPLSGSYNIVFAIDFADGVVWMLKIPANGHGQQFDELASKALVSEARTMQMIRNATTIPIPTVYAFDSSLDNELHVPFILMEQVDGKPLYKEWFNEDGCPKAQVEKFRARALQSLAAAMVQLNRFMLDQGGSIVFDSDGKAVGVEGAKIYDANATWYYKDENPDSSNEFCEKGPFTDPKSALLFMLDRRPPTHESDLYSKGIYVLLRMFIEWAYEKQPHGRRFVLSHPDFDIQNILVAEDGTLRGLIDWDGVAAVPREVGCAQYPMWLMHDWIETQYDYDVIARKPREEAGYNESSPDELSCYRAMYAQFIEQEIALNTKGLTHLTVHGTTPREEADITRRSVVMRNLEIATNRSMVTADIVDHILALIINLTEADWESEQSDCDSPSSTDSEVEAEATRQDVESDNLEKVLDLSSKGDISCKNNKNGTDTKVTEIDAEGQTIGASDPVHQQDREISSTDVSIFVAPPPSDVEVNEQENELSANTNCSEPKSAAPGWMRRVLRYGCNVAEKGLRRVIKAGHVLNDTVDEVVEVLTEVESQQAGLAGARKHRIESIHPSKVTGCECSNDTGSETLEGISVAEAVGELEPAKDDTSAQGMEPSQQPAKVHLFRPQVGNDESPSRNVELPKTAKEKEAETKEQEIWDRIATEVRNCGVPTEVLRKHEFKITTCVIDTVIDVLKAEQKQDQDVAASLSIPTAAKVTSTTIKLASSIGAEAEPDSLAEDLVPVSHAILLEEVVARSRAKVTGVQSCSSHPITPGHEVLSSKPASGLQGLYQIGNSYLKQFFSKPIVLGRGMRHSTPDSSVRSEEEPVDVRSSDDNDSPSSSVTSLGDDEVEVRENEINGKSDADLLALNVDIIAQSSDGDGEKQQGKTEDDEYAECVGNEKEGEDRRVIEVTEVNNDCGYLACTKSRHQQSGPIELSVHSKVQRFHAAEHTKAVSVDEVKKSTLTPVASDEVKVVEPADGNAVVNDTESEAGDEHSAEEDEDEDVESSSDESENIPQQPVEFIDHGAFDAWTIINVLGKGDLDELRMLRLREGFCKLLEQC